MNLKVKQIIGKLWLNFSQLKWATFFVWNWNFWMYKTSPTFLKSFLL